VLHELSYPPFRPTTVEAQLTATNDGGFFAMHNARSPDWERNLP
jgi:hypothetical protein